MKKDGMVAMVDYMIISIVEVKVMPRTYDNGNIKNHIRYTPHTSRPEWINQLRQGASKRICQTHHRRRSHSPLICKPQIRIPRRRCQHKWLSDSRQDLSKHNSSKISMRARSCSPIAYPISQQQKDG